MTGTNPLVAAPRNETKWYTGIGPVEDVVHAHDAINRGDWMEAGLSLAPLGVELAMSLHDPLAPLSVLIQAGISWVMEHVEPLKKMLDDLAGDPPVIKSYGETWHNVAKRLGQVATDYATDVRSDLGEWSGTAAASYRAAAGERVEGLRGASQASAAIGDAVVKAGQVVAMVRLAVRETISALITALIMCLIPPGRGVVTALAKIASAGRKIVQIIQKLLRSLANLARQLPKLIKGLQSVLATLRTSRAGRGTHAATTPAHARAAKPPHPKDSPGTTTPSRAADGGSASTPSTHPGAGHGSPPRSEGPPRIPGDGRPIHSRYPDGTPVYAGEQPGKIRGPHPDAHGRPHSRIQWDTHNGRPYKAREYDANGNPVRDIDFTHPTFPNGRPRPDHTAPEEHPYIPNDPNNPRAGFKRGRGRPLSYPED